MCMRSEGVEITFLPLGGQETDLHIMDLFLLPVVIVILMRLET